MNYVANKSIGFLYPWEQIRFTISKLYAFSNIICRADIIAEKDEEFKNQFGHSPKRQVFPLNKTKTVPREKRKEKHTTKEPTRRSPRIQPDKVLSYYVSPVQKKMCLLKPYKVVILYPAGSWSIFSLVL